jgi:hypothetical protein
MHGGRHVELEFRCIGWDEQPGPVVSHTIEWQLTEVGESHQQWNPTLKDGEGDLEWVDAHLIQQGEKMILHVPWPGGGLRGRAGGLRHEGLGRGRLVRPAKRGVHVSPSEEVSGEASDEPDAGPRMVPAAGAGRDLWA